MVLVNRNHLGQVQTFLKILGTVLTLRPRRACLMTLLAAKDSIQDLRPLASHIKR